MSGNVGRMAENSEYAARGPSRSLLEKYGVGYRHAGSRTDKVIEHVGRAFRCTDG